MTASRSWLRSLRPAVLACLVGVVSLTAACSHAPAPLVPGLASSPPRLVDGISGGSIPMRSDTFSVQMGAFICSTKAVRISSIELYRPTPGIHLVRWGLQNAHIDQLGASAGPLSTLGSYPDRSVTQRCHHTDQYAPIGIQLHRTGTGPQGFLGLRITYPNHGSTTVGYLGDHLIFHTPRH